MSMSKELLLIEQLNLKSDKRKIVPKSLLVIVQHSIGLFLGFVGIIILLITANYGK